MGVKAGRRRRRDQAAPGDVVGMVGAELRRLRAERGLSLQQVAAQSGFSVGFLSQAERGLSPLSIKALQDLAAVLGKPIGWFFRNGSEGGGNGESDVIVRRRDRKRIDHGRLGIVDHLLSPNLNGSLEFLLSEFAPGASSGDEPYRHEGEECGVVLQGQIEFWIGERHFLLKRGDSFSFPSSVPHRYRNPGRSRTLVVWAITPPSF